MSVNEKMTALANEIRKYGKLDSSLSIDDMTRAIAPLHELAFSEGEMSGRDVGYDEGKTDGIEQGKQAEWNAFWDMYQDNGARTDYSHGFRIAWTDTMFKPKYDLIPNSANQMFYAAQITNLKQLLENAGVALNLSEAKYVTQAFQNSTITHLPTIDFSSVSSTISATFDGMRNLVHIEKIIAAANHVFTNTFTNNTSLVDIRVEGIVASDFDIHWSPLSKASIESIVSHLSNDASGKTASFKKTAVLAAYGTEEAWLAYIASKPNWNFTSI